MVQGLDLKTILIFLTLSKFLCFLSRLAANAFALSPSIMRSSTSPWSLCLVFSSEAHFEFTASMDSSASCRRCANFFLKKVVWNYEFLLIFVILNAGYCYYCIYFASSSSSVRWMASVSYLALHWATSLLALDIPRWSSALASCSSSYCSLSKSQSWRADWTAWARAFLAYKAAHLGILNTLPSIQWFGFSKMH